MLLTFVQHSQQIVDMYINWGRVTTLPQTRTPWKTFPKTHPKYLPDPFQISLKSLPGTFLGAFKKKSAFLSPFGSPKWHQTTNFGAPWPPWGCQSQEKSFKNALEVSPCTHLEKNMKKNVNFLISQNPLDRARSAARAPFIAFFAFYRSIEGR